MRLFQLPADRRGWPRAHPEGEVVPVAEEFEIGWRAVDKLGWTALATG
ncbi:hypothetical protein [Promicromonospora aerolata]|uniref:Uncharacterized protein n=1 Tax=Promicromonospora aerolata TaxID=195749 RepID=A0ABW4VDB2_9MICO